MEFPKDHRSQRCLDDPRLEDLARYWLELTSYDLGKLLDFQRQHTAQKGFDKPSMEKDPKTRVVNCKPEIKFEGKR